ncbi:oligosaccharide flippase family protein [Gaetbulibacter saemankumensis]|uniref:oligosaccharide flippase family protein n=1 Tax=Gaetbulibacter saemankumensis TaxID=311208 RepID=UPI000481657F|nr:oligosaccharide flippase family protein [Gaetbulibacter saemankumensis]
MKRIKEYLQNLKDVKLLNDSFWSLFGNVINKGLAIMAGIIVARVLGKDVFGEYSIIKSTMTSAALFSNFGLVYTSTKFISESNKNNQKDLKLIINYSNKAVFLFSSFTAILLFFTADYVSKVIFNATSLKLALQIFSILIIANSLTSLQIGILSGLGKFKEMSKINSVIGVITFGLSVMLVFLYGFFGALWALLLAQLINWALNYKLVNKSLPHNISFTVRSKVILKDLLKFSFPVAIQEAFYSVFSWVILYLILREASFGEVGLYRASLQLNAIILFIPGILRNVILSHLSSADDKNHNKILKTVLKINFIATIIPAIILFVGASYIAQLYGETFVNLDEIIRLAVFITVFVSISNVYAQAYMSKGMNWTMLGFRLIRDIGTILLFLLALNKFRSAAKTMIYSQLFLSFVFMLIMILYYEYQKKK